MEVEGAREMVGDGGSEGWMVREGMSEGDGGGWRE